jgi:hypothetical protein
MYFCAVLQEWFCGSGNEIKTISYRGHRVHRENQKTGVALLVLNLGIVGNAFTLWTL